MIIRAATKVFSEHPYRAATLRMIGKEGGFNFSLINHYFSKSELFAAVAADSLEELFAAFVTWMDGLDAFSPGKGLSLFLDRALDYMFDQPQAVSILIQNLTREDGEAGIPGFHYFSDYVSETGARMIRDFSLSTDRAQVGMWVYGLMNLLISFVGFSPYHGRILGLDPASPEYRKWVKESLMYLYLPPLRSMFAAS